LYNRCTGGRKKKRYIKNAKAYTSPGWPENINDVVRLGMNEGDFISPHVVEYLRLLPIDMVARHYPPGELPELVDTIKKVHNIGTQTEILLYPGSDNAIDNIIRTFSEPGDTIIMRYPEYGNTVLFADTHGLNKIYIKPHPINNLRIEEITEAYDRYKPSIIYFSNPHNPSGQFLSVDNISQLAEYAKDSIVIVDEAYIHFADISFQGALHLIESFPNIIITRTFSKLFGLAGLRIGFAAVNKQLGEYLRVLQRVKDLTYISQMAALQSLKHIEEYRDVARQIAESRLYTEQQLKALGFTVFSPSYGNFVLFKPTISPSVLYERLKERGFITRFYTDEYMKDYMRVSIWRKSTMEQFITALKDVL